MNDWTRVMDILIVEADVQQRRQLEQAMRAAKIANPLHFVDDGPAIKTFFRQQSADQHLPCPALILLNLELPTTDGHQLLADLKRDDSLRHIPVIILNASKQPEDILLCYQLGAASYIPKPDSFEGMTKVMGTLKLYWLDDIVSLPSPWQR